MIYEHFRGAVFNQGGFNYNPASPADFYDWRSQTQGFEDMAAWTGAQFNLTGEGGELPESVPAGGASWNLFQVLGVQTALGRSFAQSDDHPGSNVVMLTWSLFQRRFGGDASIVGRQIHLDGNPARLLACCPRVSGIRMPGCSCGLPTPSS